MLCIMSDVISSFTYTIQSFKIGTTCFYIDHACDLLKKFWVDFFRSFIQIVPSVLKKDQYSRNSILVPSSNLV